MRGLTGAGPEGVRRSSQAVIAVGAALAALALFLAACGSGGTGARDEGPAHASAAAVAGASPSASAFGKFRRVDAVALLKRDPQVSPAVKRELKPCDGDDYQVDVSYGDLTDAPVDDVVINVMTCADWVGIGSYVYRDDDGVFRNVFKSEESPVYAEIDRGTLSVTRQYYEQDDPISSPSGDVVTPYTWKSGRFVPGKPTRNEYGKSADGSPRPVPST
ncbi:lipoprotein CseA [Streptomyces rubradiris]|nr:lipoprotein CseA [Streptomyces rubradiris]